MSRPAVTAAHLVVDCADLDRATTFWGTLLGLRLTERSEGWADLEELGIGGPVLSFQRVPERKGVKNRLHLDIEVADLDTERVRAEQLGAHPISPVFAAPVRPWQVFADPDGNEFCLVSREPAGAFRGARAAT
jgi:catechol 2,3-dioxygenase-like lactoylglutathione lyase family enzyme